MKFECYRHKEKKSLYLLKESTLFGLGKIKEVTSIQILKAHCDGKLGSSNIEIGNEYEDGYYPKIISKEIATDDGYLGNVYKEIKIPLTDYELISYTVEETD